MGQLSRNLLANLVGQGWLTLLNLVAIPLYIRLMGIESYGLIGFYTTLQTLIPLFDLGIAPTVNREMARYSVQPNKREQARDLMRTFEVGYWLIGLIVSGALLFAASWIAGDWIKPVNLSEEVVRESVMAMSALVFLQFPFNLYQSALLGLQRQVTLNVLLITMTTLRIGGTLVVLLLISPTIMVFLVWQIVVAVLQLALGFILLWQSIQIPNHSPRLNFGIVRATWRFAAGMSGLTISSLILMQIDKIVLSSFVSLEMFGYYSLASVVANGLAVVINPVFNTFFPRFSSHVATEDERTLRQMYLLGTQLMTVLIFPIALVVVFFASDLILLWTGSVDAVSNTATIVIVLTVGTALGGLMLLPQALRLAYAWTSLGLQMNLFFLVIMVPAMLFMASRYGLIGAAMVVAGINIIYVLLGIPLTHRRVLKGEARRWFQNVGLLLVWTWACVWIGRQLVSSAQSSFVLLSEIGLVLGGTILLATLVANQVRATVWQMFSNLFVSLKRQKIS